MICKRFGELNILMWEAIASKNVLVHVYDLAIRISTVFQDYISNAKVMESKCPCWHFINLETSTKSTYGKVFVKILKHNADEGKTDWKRYSEACSTEKALAKICVAGTNNVEHTSKLLMWPKNQIFSIKKECCHSFLTFKR